ncbi:RNase H domain-containing protein [Trichonephila clavipes]|nr:RNase H domain-containing protein [Trichonephila clavipes]
MQSRSILLAVREETNTTGSGVLIELPGRVIKIQRRNFDHASVFRTELIAIICGISLINNIRDQAFSAFWILRDNRSSIQHLSNWPSIGGSTSRSILHLFLQISDWHPSHVGLLGTKMTSDDLAKRLTVILGTRKTTLYLRQLRSIPGLKN